MRAAILTALLCTACSSHEISHEEARLENLRFEVPTEWTRTDSKQRGVITSQWAPQNNERKESLTVIRSERSPAVARTGSEQLVKILNASQRSLSKLHSSQARPIRTAHGLAGVRIEVDFIPHGMTERYHRVHAVLVDKDVLVHVLYTARVLDDETKSLDLVLDSIHRGEA